MNLIDVLIIGFILLGALQGYRKGFLTGLVNLLASIVGLVLAASQYLNVYNWLERTFSLQSLVEARVYKLILPRLQGELTTQGLSQILPSLPNGWGDLFGGLATLPNMQSVVPQQVFEEAAHRLAGVISQNLLYLFAFALVYIVIVALAQIIWSIIMAPFGAVGGAANRGGGLILGGLASLLGLAILAGIISPVLKLGFNGTVFSLIESSLLYPYLIHIFDLVIRLFSIKVTENFRLNLPEGIWF
ncbi:CvpA family protein [Paradesulfitobacterium ferrireducens]|uniref:CvpA family protein n=1 Tax=Paradesulfitobacterium ferrireducens TaxID=2816476 RepID=UPI001A8D3344|nr:CvpA family protein [Paradesulfitobacterium ferrireducens]